MRRQRLTEAEMPTMEQLDSGDGMTTLYRVAFKDQLGSIFKYGYNRAFTGTKGGNMYGPGVYCTFNLRDSINNVQTKPEYGDCIIAMRLVGGFSNFIIFDERLAKATYGDKWQIHDQLVNVAGMRPDDAMNVERSCSRQSSLYHGRTAPAAYSIWRTFRKDIFKSHGVRGLIYKGNRDGHCALPYDFSAVIPYAVSFDQGKTFKKKLTVELYNHIKDHTDVEFQFGGKYQKVLQSVRGFTMVMNHGKYNVIQNSNEQAISKVWFEQVDGQINPSDGKFGFTYGGIHFTGCILTPDGGTETGCICDDEGDPFCEFSDLRELVNAMKQCGASTISEFEQMNEGHRRLRQIIGETVRRTLYESRTVGDDGRVTIDNFDEAKQYIINAETDDDVWFVQIIKRHKDNMDQHFERNACQFIASYLIHDAEELDHKRDEIIHTCIATNSRAYLQPNKRSRIAVTDYANNVLRPRFERYRDKYRMGHEIEVAAGQSKDWPERKLCFLDVDSDDEHVYEKVKSILDAHGIQPIWTYRSLNNGWHILLPDKEQARNIDFSVIDNGNKFGRFSTVGLEIDKPILLFASLKPNGYGLQKSVQQRKMGRHRHHR